MADVVISTSMGEGWGLSSIEAMAAKTPVIMPDNTSFKEICANQRCRLIPCGKNDNWACFGRVDYNRIRPIVDTKDVVKELEYAYKHPKEMQKMAQRAYEWVTTELTWEKVCEKWKVIFRKASTEVPKLKRNDICPVCNKKYKKCSHGGSQ
jgi:glycosyltransferase involved in cell wall biosynthesis